MAEVSGGKVLRLTGDRRHPVTRGRLCPKARFQLDRHRSSHRLTDPLVRSGGRLRRASWDEALDAVAERLLRAREQGGSRAVVHYWDSGSMGLLKNLYQRLFNLFGGVTEPRGSLCWAAGLEAQRRDFGQVLAHSPEDTARAAAVIIWGRNPADTNTHALPFIEQAHRRGAPVAVVDPVRTRTARDLADRHITPRPGTDAVLALAVAGELVRRGAYDREFCLERADGFEEFAALARGVRLVDAAARCGIDENDVLWLADLLERRRPAAFLIGYGLQRHHWGGEAVRAIDALAAAAGSIGRPGGGASYANRHAEGALRDIEGTGLARERRFFDRPRLARQVAVMRGPRPEVFFCDRANPVSQLPDARRTVETVRGIPFKVVVDIAATETTELADVVLPAADFLEDEDLYFCSWHTYFTWSVPAVSPRGQARPETWIIAELARRLGLGDSFRRTPAEWITWALAPLAGRNPALAPGGDVLALRGTAFPNPEAPAVPWREGPFATPSGRFEFGRAWRCLEESPPGQLGRPRGGCGPQVFHLLSPQHRLTIHSQFYDRVMSRTSRGSGLPAVFANPRAAVRLGLADGDEVLVRSAQGSLRAHLALDAGLREDTLLIYSGGRVGLSGREHPASANLLTPDRLTDMGVQAAFYDCPCTLEPAREWGAAPARTGGRATAPHRAGCSSLAGQV